MAFNAPLPFGPRIAKPAISPLTAPQLMPEQQMGRGNQSRVHMDMNSDNVPASTPESKPNKSGRRKGGRSKTKRTEKSSSPVGFARGKSNSNNNYVSPPPQASDFGYETEGSNTPTTISTSKDTSLFRDNNVKSQFKKGSNEGDVLNSTPTNEAIAIKVNFKPVLNPQGLTWLAFWSEWQVIWNNWNREVISGTVGSKGAIDNFSKENVQNYLNAVIVGFDTLIQLEVLLAWGPTDRNFFDQQLRHLAAQGSSSVELLQARTKLRDALRTCVLPVNTMKYLRWLREVKSSNSSPQSCKLQFTSTQIDELRTTLLSNSPDVSTFVTYINDCITDIYATNAALPALLTERVKSAQFDDVFKYYNTVHNSACFDPTWLDMYNNMGTSYASTASPESWSNYPQVKDTTFAGFMESPTSTLALANTALTIGNHNYGAPFINNASPAIKGGANYFNVSSIIYVNGNGYTIKANDAWYKTGSDRMHLMEDGSLTLTGIQWSSRAKGFNVIEYYPSKENVQMAQRLALNETLR